MNKMSKRILLCLTLSYMFFVITGCSGVIRENILSSINTGIGVTLAENPQTQLYEVKIGYIRSQFYSIPTGKMILEEDSDRLVPQSGGGQPLMTKYNPNTINAADKTPQVVSGIKVRTGAQQLFLGVDVSENFAVGTEAVKSNAAIAMYIASAEDPKNAQAASDAVNSLTYDNDPNIRCLNNWLKDKKNIKTLNDWWKQNSESGIGVLGIKAKENKDMRDKFIREHPEITCD